MVVLRATRKVLRRLPPRLAGIERDPDTALGDWYADRMVVDRQPLLLLVSSASLLSILVPARDVRSLPDRLPELVADRLGRLGIAGGLIRAEVDAMAPVAVAPTRSRSVLGSMNDFARLVSHYLPENGWDEATLPLAESRLARMPCRVMRAREAIFPDLAAPDLLARRWPGKTASAGPS